eukprot:CAMPEP_0177653818 /NCGR_PEP_ID=MMETSP0447-20121125/13953_1 /TAXON_ID=0 /ORGANISM="Stygamoeba regulata, Strain BSH-02190019" /LENGTH=326 /DNA_ID=CAMNT_0019157329 /DNA_START=108 /DNA_END=1088 /DNA_ORIENTATION=-
MDGDALYKYSPEAHEEQVKGKPWVNNPHYFQKVKISATALVKMTMHARSAGDLEIMGLLQGTVSGSTMIVMDAFALPGHGTHTRVNPEAEHYEYLVGYVETIQQVGRLENVMGWYHSHPGYGCWLSGIDVSTQMLNQSHQDPWLAIVIDPKRTMSSGKVDIGAFRTYPEGYKPPISTPSEYQAIPLNKIEDFGVQKDRYYQLEVSYFSSSLHSHLVELLWTKYWVNTLSSSPIITNRDYMAGQVTDLADKLEQAEMLLHQHHGRSGREKNSGTQEDSQLGKLIKDGQKTVTDQLNGLQLQVIKKVLFSGLGENAGEDKDNMQISST